MNTLTKIATATTVGLLVASPAAAHLNPAEHGSFAAGFSHPLFGLDHVLAMIAVGLWASIQGRRATLAVPATFVGTMVVGFLIAMAGVSLPLVEPMILASVVLLGMLVAFTVRPPIAVSAGIVAVFALFHGFAHGGEMGAATPTTFLAGFAIGTALLHMAGIGLGIAIGRLADGSAATGGRVGRTLGAVTATMGLGLVFGVL